MNLMKTYSVIIFGIGSIGKRHLTNLLNLGFNDICVYDPNTNMLDEVTKKYNVNAVDKSDLWSRQYDIALITNPNAFHLQTAVDAARNNCHLFIEKPLATGNDGLPELLDLVQSNNLITIVGCNMRFHPGPKKVKQLMEEGAIGRVLTAHIDGGFALPKWRPWQDY